MLPELARVVAVEVLGEIVSVAQLSRDQCLTRVQSKIDEQCKEKARLKLEQLLMEENYAVRKSAITGKH